MNFLELVTKRCSIRRFASTPVEIEKIEYILEAARLSPSAVNFQPWTFVVVQQEEGKQKLHLRKQHIMLIRRFLRMNRI